MLIDKRFVRISLIMRQRVRLVHLGNYQTRNDGSNQRIPDSPPIYFFTHDSKFKLQPKEKAGLVGC